MTDRVLGTPLSLESVFAPVRSRTAFEETVDRLGTAIKLGLLPAGERLPAERELCQRLGIARSTLRQALTALGQSGYLLAVRGRGGGTFVVDKPPRAEEQDDVTLGMWHEICDERLVIEIGVAVLAADRATSEQLDALGELVTALDRCVEDFPLYRQLDVRFHVGLAETTGSQRLVAAMTQCQGAMSDLIHHIAHPPGVLANANGQHARLLEAMGARDLTATVQTMTDHVHGTEHILAGLLPR
ncbi:MAG: FadR family transcriptional regulator [Solirubrobacterales bacterium]|nr:FadR family transcriptional regulator [Solirubrobacterales bacterium]